MALFDSFTKGDSRFLSAFETLASAAKLAADAYADSVRKQPDRSGQIADVNLTINYEHSGGPNWFANSVAEAVAAATRSSRPQDRR